MLFRNILYASERHIPLIKAAFMNPEIVDQGGEGEGDECLKIIVFRIGV